MKVFSKFVNYQDNYAVDVDIPTKTTATGYIKGLLSFGGGQSAVLSIKDFFESRNMKGATTIKCQCDSYHYLLINCTFDGFEYRPEYVIRSSINTNQKFKKINCLLNGFTEWVIGAKSINWSADRSAFSYSFESKRFSLDIDSYNGNKVRISNDYLVDSPNNIAGLELNEYCVITIENLDGSFTPEQVKDVVFGVRRVLSILAGFPLHVRYIYDTAESNDKSLYFAATLSVLKNLDFHLNCLYRADYLFSSSGINMALHNYFTNDKNGFDNAWGRLYGLLDFRGFWENKLLLAVSLLDKASVDISKPFSKSMRENRPFKKIRSELYSLLEKYEQESDEVHKEIFQNLKEQMTNLKYQRLYSFEQNYCYLVQVIGPACCFASKTDPLNPHICVEN